MPKRTKGSKNRAREQKVWIWNGFSNDLGIHLGSILAPKFMKMLQKSKPKIDAEKVTGFDDESFEKTFRNSA